MRQNWEDSDVALAWAKAVDESGDVFQRLIIKPYLAAALSNTETLDGGATATAFYRILQEAGELQSVHEFVQQVESRASPALADLNSLRVLDLGGGEGFLGRWLSDVSDEHLVIDISEPLLRVGLEKSQSSGKVRFLRGDLDEIEADDEFAQWLAACSPFPPEARPSASSDFSLVLCINVLDHLKSPLLAMSSLARMLAERPNPPEVIISTLNPDFFLASEAPFPVLPAGQQPEVRTVTMGPAGKTVEIVPRSWMTMERILCDAGFSVLSCDPIHISQYPRPVQAAFIESAKLDSNPSAGPFVLWRLEVVRRGEFLSRQELEEAAKQSRVLGAICRTLGCDDGQKDFPVRRLTYKPNEIIARKSNLPPGLFVVSDGEAEVHARGEVRQVFGQNDVFGELELGDDPFVGRFLYPVRAGPRGCEVLLIDNLIVRRLASKSEQESLARVLYDVLRQRMGTYSWVYHRSTPTTRPLSELTFNQRECETLSRVLLFSATMEGGKLREEHPPVVRNDGLSVLISLEAMKRAVSDESLRSPPAVKGGPPMARTCGLFHALGLIDAFKVSDYCKSNARTIELCRASFKRLIALACIKLFAEPLAHARSSPEEWSRDTEGLLDSFDAERPPAWPRATTPWGTLISGRLIKAISETNLVLDKEARDFAAALIADTCTRYQQLSSRDVRQAAFRFVLNLAFLQMEFFHRPTPRFFVINDMYALRRFAMGSAEWATEFKQRAQASPYVRLNGGHYEAKPGHADAADEWRFEAYVKRFEMYAANIWDAGLDLRHTHDVFYETPDLIRRALKSLER